MPELPEVETIVCDLRHLVQGRQIEKIRVSLPKIVRTGPRRLGTLLSGAVITGARRRGKFIVLTFSENRYLVIHLKMTGHFLFCSSGLSEPIPKHVHVIFTFDNQTVLLYEDQRQFGYFLGLDQAGYEAWLESDAIGPDPLEISTEKFTLRLSGKKSRIKAVLLDQKIVSGLGNIYVDESLFAAGLHPGRPADSINRDDFQKLHKEMVRILSESITCRGSTTNNYVGLMGVGGEFQNRHQVYGKAGQPCPKCGQTITRIVLAGRGTHFCSHCQPEA
ncbi:MAG: bifunctional DNA-formamidopyrimidine glycosylase/DNA-(apurinic or apyrimidinic site) lyase [Deltaproteobacteria bacterium]|nr:bifunctional DNA-formamidopyrimidine glycosylase/DNA-(apurinic or apyrimidinic site) lyase [Deltaproteobacteria bacterium]